MWGGAYLTVEFIEEDGVRGAAQRMLKAINGGMKGGRTPGEDGNDHLGVRVKKKGA